MMILKSKRLILPALLSALLASTYSTTSAQGTTASPDTSVTTPGAGTSGASGGSSGSSGGVEARNMPGEAVVGKGPGSVGETLHGKPLPYQMELEKNRKVPLPTSESNQAGSTSGASGTSGTDSSGASEKSDSADGKELPGSPRPYNMDLGKDNTGTSQGSGTSGGTADSPASSTSGTSGSTSSTGSADTTSGASGTGGGTSSGPSAGGTTTIPVPVTVPVTVLVPVQVRDDPTLHGGCWVRMVAGSGQGSTSGSSGTSSKAEAADTSAGGTSSSSGSSGSGSTAGDMSSGASGASSTGSGSGAASAANELTVVGDLNLATLDTPSGVNWSQKADSLIIGPKASVTVYEDKEFKGNSATLKSGQKVSDLRKELGFVKSIDSLKVNCES